VIAMVNPFEMLKNIVNLRIVKPLAIRQLTKIQVALLIPASLLIYKFFHGFSNSLAELNLKISRHSD